jgi:hypothetical protein
MATNCAQTSPDAAAGAWAMSQHPTEMSKPFAIAMGAINLGIGAYFILVGLGVLPIPGGSSALHGPLWMVVCAGTAFLLAGVALAMRAVPNYGGDLDTNLPGWSLAIRHVLGVGVSISLAAIGTWIAFGPGVRHFETSAPFFGLVGNAGEATVRAWFGLGAIVIWIYAIAMTWKGMRKLISGIKQAGTS